MSLLRPDDRTFAQAVSHLVFCNPFTPERIDVERAALGSDFEDSPLVWSLRPEAEGERANIRRLVDRVEPLAERLREELAGGAAADAEELVLYEDLVLYLLYERCRGPLGDIVTASRHGRVAYWHEFLADFNRFLIAPGRPMPGGHEPAHLFACFFQIRRAFLNIFGAIVGGSLPAARLRATVWQSIFTHDLRRYASVLYRHMGDMTTLVCGPSGTGKELVARAIGRSRYIPFDAARERFEEDFAHSFFALNLSALSPTLIESELFGHKRGAFTGAVADRAGWLETCPPLGTVFLDEIGELDPAIQVKLLRVLQTRAFQRLGDTTDRRFEGKIVAATNRDLAEELARGRLREDLYYRLCSDIVVTPSLREQLADCPDDLPTLVRFIARGIAGEESEAISGEAVAWIEQRLDDDYPWTGNIRELEQCVRNIVIRRRYEPPRRRVAGATAAFLDDVARGRLTVDELVTGYTTMVYGKSSSFEEAARRLGVDRRTVKARVDRDLLARIREAP